MNAPLSRRALLGATAAFGAGSLPSVALASLPEASAPDADAALLDLIARHAEAEATWEASCRDLEVARDRAWAAYPPRPVVLTATSLDLLHGLAPSGQMRKSNGLFWIFFNLDDLDRLRAAGPITSLAWDADGESLSPVPNPTGEARRREIIQTYDNWLAERAAVDRRMGLSAAEAIEGPLCAVMEEAEAAVEACAPTTSLGMRAKARWALARADRDDALLLFVRQLVGEAAPPADDENADDMLVTA